MSQSPDALAGVVARVTEALREAQKHGRGTFDAMEPYEAVVAASIADEDIAALLAALAEAQASRAAVRAERDAEILRVVERMKAVYPPSLQREATLDAVLTIISNPEE